MSKYTTELRYICESYANLNQSADYIYINTVLENAWDKVFSFSFPVFDEAYRETLCRKILKYYYTREICAETVGRWKLFLENRMNYIMPKYNKLYTAIIQEVNPLYDFDYTRTYTKTNEGNQENTGETTVNTTDTPRVSTSEQSNVTGQTTGNTSSKYSDTPQGAITGLANDNYLTNATIGTNSGNTTSSENKTVTQNGTNTTEETGSATNTIDVNNTEEYVEHVLGKKGDKSYFQLIKEYSENIIDIDDMIIDDLADLFMGIY